MNLSDPMINMPPVHLFWLSTLVFSIGLVVVLIKSNVLFMLIGIELMFHAAIYNFMLFSSYDHRQQGQVFVLFIMAMTLCETAVALAIIFKVYHTWSDTTNLNQE